LRWPDSIPAGGASAGNDSDFLIAVSRSLSSAKRQSGPFNPVRYSGYLLLTVCAHSPFAPPTARGTSLGLCVLSTPHRKLDFISPHSGSPQNSASFQLVANHYTPRRFSNSSRFVTTRNTAMRFSDSSRSRSSRLTSPQITTRLRLVSTRLTSPLGFTRSWPVSSATGSPDQASPPAARLNPGPQWSPHAGRYFRGSVANHRNENSSPSFPSLQSGSTGSPGHRDWLEHGPATASGFEASPSGENPLDSRASVHVRPTLLYLLV